MIPSSYVSRETMLAHLDQPRRSRIPEGGHRRDRGAYVAAASILGGWVVALDALSR